MDPLGRDPLEIPGARRDRVPDVAAPAVQVASPRAELAVVPDEVAPDDDELWRVEQAHTPE
jgi:hypothetical protein